jgi:hypothetical protein
MMDEDRRKLCELHADMKWVKKMVGDHIERHRLYEKVLILGTFALMVKYLVEQYLCRAVW